METQSFWTCRKKNGNFVSVDCNGKPAGSFRLKYLVHVLRNKTAVEEKEYSYFNLAHRAKRENKRRWTLQTLLGHEFQNITILEHQPNKHNIGTSKNSYYILEKNALLVPTYYLSTKMFHKI